MTLRIPYRSDKLEFQIKQASGEPRWIKLNAAILSTMEFYEFVDYLKSTPTVNDLIETFTDNPKFHVGYQKFLDVFGQHVKKTLVYQLCGMLTMTALYIDPETWTFTMSLEKTTTNIIVYDVLATEMTRTNYKALIKNVDRFLYKALVYYAVELSLNYEILDFIYNDDINCRVSICNNTIVFRVYSTKATGLKTKPAIRAEYSDE